MTDDTPSQLPADVDSGLRRRNPPQLVDDTEATSSPPQPEPASWQLQLAEARRAMALKMAQQAQELDQLDPAPAHDSTDAAEPPGGHDSGSSPLHQRRVSVASSEGDDQFVEQLLRPTSAPTAAPVHEDPEPEVGGGAAGEEELQQDEGGERAAEEQDPDPVDDRICRICFGGAEDEEELGRMFSPCVCRGTVRRLSLLFPRKAPQNNAVAAIGYR